MHSVVKLIIWPQSVALMAPWDFLLLAVLQGMLEWLPVSSQGQTVIVVVNAMSMSLSEAIAIALFLHLGTMIVVLIRFHEDFQNAWGEFVDNIRNRNPLQLETGKVDMATFLILVTVGTGITAIPILLLFSSIDDAVTEGVATIAVGLMLLATAFLLFQQEKREEGKHDLLDLPWWTYFLLGVAQGIAAIPGVSRSGTTVTFLLLAGVKGKDAFRGSFLISVPAVIGAIIVELIIGDISMTISGVEHAGDGTLILSWFWVCVVTLITFLVGWASMDILLRMADRYEFWKIVLPMAILAIAFGIFAFAA